ncbi:hypothetical protein C2S52_002513 [Perilla frutescens var. hirtella]|nr:hypothetical protein C2S52_002513 [Perilla frutescens var. hirtella]
MKTEESVKEMKATYPTPSQHPDALCRANPVSHNRILTKTINFLDDGALRLQIKKKYIDKRKPMYSRRNQIIGDIPCFWLIAIFCYLDSVVVEDFADPRKGYYIAFNFMDNPFFSNKILSRTINFLADGTFRSVGTTIEWKAGKVNKEANVEILKIKKKYIVKQKPMYSRRNQIIGDIPCFWLIAVTDRNFWANTVFHNRILTKTINLSDDGTLRSIGTTIDWKAGKVNAEASENILEYMQLQKLLYMRRNEIIQERGTRLLVDWLTQVNEEANEDILAIELRCMEKRNEVYKRRNEVIVDYVRN